MDSFEPFGIGIYLSASYFDHSCQPNARVVFDGKKALVMATKNIYSIEKSNCNQVSEPKLEDLSTRVIFMNLFKELLQEFYS